MAEPMRPAIRMAIITGASSLAMAMPTTPPTALDRLRSTSTGPVCRAMTAADEKRQHADHQQAGVADLKELVKDLLPLPPRLRQSQQRAPEQQDDFSDVLKHDSSAVSLGGGGFGNGEIKQLRPFVVPVTLILEKAEQERDFFVRRRGLAAV